MTRCPHTHTTAEGNNYRDPQEPRYEPYNDERASCKYTRSRSHSFAPPQAHAGRCLMMSTALGNVEHCVSISTMLTLTTIHNVAILAPIGGFHKSRITLAYGGVYAAAPHRMCLR